MLLLLRYFSTLLHIEVSDKMVLEKYFLTLYGRWDKWNENKMTDDVKNEGVRTPPPL